MPNNWAGPYRGRQIPVLTAEAFAEREHQRPFAERPQGWDAVGATLRGAFNDSPIGTALAWGTMPQLAPQELAGTASDDERRRFADRIPEAEWAASDWVRPGLAWEPGMTRSRARFQAQHYDDQRLYDALAADNPLLDIIAGTLVDPFTYLPATRIVGLGARALGFGAKVARLEAGVARLNPVVRAAVREGADNALGTAIGEGLVMPLRADLGEQPSFEDYIGRVALDGLFGAALGAGVTVVGGRARRRPVSARAAPGQGGTPSPYATGGGPPVDPNVPSSGGGATFIDEAPVGGQVTTELPAVPDAPRLEPPPAASAPSPPITRYDLRAALRGLKEAALSLALGDGVRVSRATAARVAEASERVRSGWPSGLAGSIVGAPPGSGVVRDLNVHDVAPENAGADANDVRRGGASNQAGRPAEADTTASSRLDRDSRSTASSLDEPTPDRDGRLPGVSDQPGVPDGQLHAAGPADPVPESVSRSSEGSPPAPLGDKAISAPGEAATDASVAVAGLSVDAPSAPAGSDPAPKVPRPQGAEYEFWPKLRRVYQKVFFATHPHLYKKVEIHHAVEQKVFKKYGHVLTQAEMHGLANLRGIPLTEEGSIFHRKTIAGEWNAFYKAHKTATKAQLFAKAREIDRKYGHRFKPPVTVED